MAKVTLLVHQRMAWVASGLKVQVESLTVNRPLTVVLDAPLGFALEVLDLLEPPYAIVTSSNSPYYLAHLVECKAAAILIEPIPETTLVSALKVLGMGETISLKLPPTTLTPREQQTLRLLAQGKNDKQIAASLRLEVKTIANFVQSLHKKLGAQTREELSAKYWGKSA